MVEALFLVLACNGAAAHDTTLDTGCEDPQAWFPDEDGDGFGAGATTLACDQSIGHVLTPGDCDDQASDINPQALDMCGDGVDQNCTGADCDRAALPAEWEGWSIQGVTPTNGEGLVADAWNGSASALLAASGDSRGPGRWDLVETRQGWYSRPARLGSGFVVGGEPDTMVYVPAGHSWSPSLKYAGYCERVFAGQVVSGLTEDVVCSGPGVVELIDGTDTGTVVEPTASWRLMENQYFIGVAADGTGEGASELLFIDEVQSLATYIDGEHVGEIPPISLRTLYSSGAVGVSALGDTDGDGLAEVAITTSTTPSRIARIGPDLHDDDFFASFGEWLQPYDLGDVDADGYDDVGVVTDNAVYLWYGPLSGSVLLADAPLSWNMDFEPFGWRGHVAAADATGDGHTDILVGPAGGQLPWLLFAGEDLSQQP